MPSINISISAELKKYVEGQIKSGSYGNVSEYFRSLIRDHQKRAAQERLELALLEGIASGSAGAMTQADWGELRKSAVKRAELKGRKISGEKQKRKQDKAGA